jgi:hypothetical protein
LLFLVVFPHDCGEKYNGLLWYDGVSEHFYLAGARWDAVARDDTRRFVRVLIAPSAGHFGGKVKAAVPGKKA